MPDPSPAALIVVAHGTTSPVGSATTRRIADAVAARRSDVEVDLCFLDIDSPDLAAALDRQRGPVIVVPLLLSTGYHVQTDIPAIVAGRPQVRVARHLGPHPLLARAMAERLAERLADVPGMVEGHRAAPTLMVAAGSSRSEARDEIERAGAMLAAELGCSVRVATMTDDLEVIMTEAERPDHVVPYLLAEGSFTDRLQDIAAGAIIAPPLGPHPAVASLVWTRYDEVASERPPEA